MTEKQAIEKAKRQARKAGEWYFVFRDEDGKFDAVSQSEYRHGWGQSISESAVVAGIGYAGSVETY